MGEVYLADDPTLDRQVALKVLSPATTLDETARQRLIREAQAAARLEHPNVCAIYEVGEDRGTVYFAMQYIDGEMLSNRIARGPVAADEVLRIASEVADALSEAHARGIVHRDIKPQNIMLSARGVVKVLDFGLAKAIDEDRRDGDSETVAALTEAGTIPGTTAYMSPEQLRGEPLDARTDIFSFGCVMYEMVSGRRAFARPSAAGTIAAILSGPPPLLDPTPGSSQLPRIIGKCLETDKDRRYTSAQELLADLRDLRSGSTSALSGMGQPPAARSVRRGAYVATGLVFVVLAAGGWIWSRRDASSSPGSTPVLAILPFASPEKGAQDVGEGISDDLINILSQLPQLKVKSAPALRYTGAGVDVQAVGRDLGVGVVVTGRVGQQGGMLVVQAELHNAVDGTLIWGNRYTRPGKDIFAVQEEIARDIAGNLRLRLSPRDDAGLSKRYTSSVDAYRNYMQGRAYAQRRTPAGFQTAIGLYQQAIAQDGRYALAYAGLADAYLLLTARGFLPIVEGRRKAREAAATALELDPDLAEAHAAAGQFLVYAAPYDFTRGELELRRAIELSPSWAIAHQFLGVALIEQGRLDEGLKAWETARDLDPLSPFIARLVAYAHFLRRDYARALTLQRQANQLGPGFSNHIEIEIYIQNAAFDEALAELDRVTPGRERDHYLQYCRAQLFAARNRRAEALAIVRQLEETAESNMSAAVLVGRVYLTLGDRDRAFEWLNRGLDAGGIFLFYKDAPLWDPVRTDQRFVKLLRQMVLPGSG